MLGFPLKKIDKKDSARPVLKWAGGKGSLLPQLIDKFPNKLRGAIKRYVEPFIGGGAVFFDIYNTYYVEEAFLFDINPELIIMYNVIKKDVESLISELETLQTAYVQTSDQSAFYYAMRDEYNTFDKQVNVLFYHKSFVRRAALTIFLNRTCFNGLFRVNSKGLFNVPMGRYKNPRILDVDNLRAVSNAFKNATILQADFETTLKYANPSTFIYYDPPYRPLKASSFNAYAVGDFNDDEQCRLKDVFAKADKMGALQMLSNSDPTNAGPDAFFDDLYHDYNIDRLFANRMINANPDGRNTIREILITNYTS